MLLKDILLGIDDLKVRGNLDTNINEIRSSSNQVQDGDMFVAIEGFDTDGHKYISEAIKNGANAIIAQTDKITKEMLKDIPQDITVILAPDTRHAISICACNFYKNPSRKLKLIGVTGTKGKTTTSFMIKEILETQGKKVGLIGTVANYIGSKNLGESSRTTPDSIELQRLFAEMVEEKVDCVVMEVSSQGLKHYRVEGITFAIGIYTNLSMDHIGPG